MAASTTKRLTIGVLALIHRYCVTFNCGVIVRIKGVDYGIKADDLVIEGNKTTWINAPAKFNTLTIPKATIKQMELDFWVEDKIIEEPPTATATLFADLPKPEQEKIRNSWIGRFALAIPANTLRQWY